MQFIQGKKTYLIAAIGVAMGVYDALIPYLHLAAIPGWVFVILGFLGLSAGRSAITTDTQKAVTDVLAQVIVPPATAPVTVNVTNSGSQTETEPPPAPHFATAKNRP
jgi:hypothetical protein